jgi:hypothetical protein
MAHLLGAEGGVIIRISPGWSPSTSSTSSSRMIV